MMTGNFFESCSYENSINPFITFTSSLTSVDPKIRTKDRMVGYVAENAVRYDSKKGIFS